MIREYLVTRAAQEGFSVPSPSSTVTAEAPPVTTQQTEASSAKVASLLAKLSGLKADKLAERQMTETDARVDCMQGIVQVAKEREREF